VTGGSVPETTLRKRIACENYPPPKNWTLNSDCVCRGPWCVFRDEWKSGTLREIESKQPVRWESACLVRRESVETPLLKLLVDLLVDGSRSYLRHGALRDCSVVVSGWNTCLDQAQEAGYRPGDMETMIFGAISS